MINDIFETHVSIVHANSNGHMDQMPLTVYYYNHKYEIKKIVRNISVEFIKE